MSSPPTSPPHHGVASTEEIFELRFQKLFEDADAMSMQGYLANGTLAVNVSALQFDLDDFAEQVLAILDRTGAPPQKLTLELTESMLVSHVEEVIAKMKTLQARGVSFSLDDFVTGYSSLSCLKRLPLHQLKIDQGFVRATLKLQTITLSTHPSGVFYASPLCHPV